MPRSRRIAERSTRGMLALGLALLSTGLWQHAPAQMLVPEPPPALPLSHSQNDVTVLRSDNAGLVVVYTPRYLPGGGSPPRWDFVGSVPRPLSEYSGQPDLRYRELPIALPALEGNRVSILASDYEEIHNIQFPVLPPLRDEDGRLVGRSGERPSLRAFSQAEVFVGGLVRGIVTGSLRIFPLTYDAASQTLRKYSRIVVEVTFGPVSPGVEARGDDPLLRDALMNYRSLRPAGRARTAPRTAASSVLATGDWFKMTVTADGIYRLDASSLSAAGVNVSSLDPRTLRIYGNGGTELPEDPTAIRPSDLVENAIYVSGESDGKFDGGDYLLFYGRGVRGWRYDSTARAYRHYLHHYTEGNVYWLTYGGAAGKRMATRASVDSPPAVVTDQTVGLAFIEEEKTNPLGSGKDWLGQTLSGPNSSFTHVTSLPGLVQGSTIRYRFRLVAKSDTPPSVTIKESGTVLATAYFSVAAYEQAGTPALLDVTGSSSLSNSTSALTFTLNSSSAFPQAWIDWVEISYPQRLWASGDYLRFRAPATTALVEYSLQQFTAAPMVFDVTVPQDVRLITGVGGSYMFRANERANTPSEYCAAAPSAWKTPVAVERVANQNLRGSVPGADFLILTTPEFKASADRLKALREQPQYGNLRTQVLDVQLIYNEFSGGLPDISGIRDFLKFAYENWTTRPRFVLLLGQASYDYKAILGSRSSYVPTWQSEESLHEIASYSSDDFFGRFTTSTAPSLVIGRINARSAAEAQTVVEKIYRYEQSSARDTWKMRVLFVGDDGWTSDGGESDGILHSEQIETLASIYTPPELEKQKIYIAEYPTVNAAQGRRKPSANQAIIDGINQGALLVNFAGHGNQKVWAHEWVFEVGTSIPQLRNANRLSLFFLGTCNFSVYDDPKVYTGSELLMNRTEGGAVAVVAANRKVYAGDNAALNQGSFRFMFTRDAYDRLTVDRPATALFLFKATGGNSVNDQKYGFMGDPTMYLQYPRTYASIDSINAEPVDSVGGGMRTRPIQLRSLSRVTVKGTMRDNTMGIDPGFTGTLTLQVNDVSREQTIVDFYPGFNWSYTATGGMVYRGESSVTNGRFTATFVVPKDIAYADTAGRGRLVGYVTGSSTDGAAYTGNIYIGGTDSLARKDTRGPEVSIYLGSKTFRAGDVVTERPMLYVDLMDSSGINTSTTSIGHRIEAWINNSAQSTDLTEHFSGALDDFRRGTAAVELGPLPTGRNAVRVRAWDSYNNSAQAETYFEVAPSGRLTIGDVFNYPNPFRNETFFTFRHNQDGTVHAKVKVYTLAGRTVRTLEEDSDGGSFVKIPWDGRDEDGDPLANGVYLYKVIVRTGDGRFSSEVLGRLSIVR